MKSRIVRPTRSLPVSLMKSTGTPMRPSEMMPLNTEPPGTAAVGCPSRNNMSRIVSPIPITFRFIVLICLDDEFSPYYIMYAARPAFRRPRPAVVQAVFQLFSRRGVVPASADGTSGGGVRLPFEKKLYKLCPFPRPGASVFLLPQVGSFVRTCPHRRTDASVRSWRRVRTNVPTGAYGSLDTQTVTKAPFEPLPAGCTGGSVRSQKYT